ncbi:MAG: FAD-dependent oxidoreductase [Hyphomicrobium sp.]|uniref:NAD(P)/FAD-dependent oxidoreductase n=1 Tax=Hyphomicrobium sp. TaxID=82 RepID=UPI0039E3F378
MGKKVAIIGAGLAGLTCARTLRQAGIAIEVFEAEGHAGGRIATMCAGNDRFDHGAQYLCAQSDEFRSYLAEISGLGYADQWLPRVAEAEGHRVLGGEPWIVGVPGMSSIVRPLTDGVRVAFGRRVQSLEQREKGWHLWFEDEKSSGPFDFVAIAVPAAEAMRLLDPIKGFAPTLRRVRMLPCWALMVRIDDKTFPDLDVFRNVSQVLHWIARDNSKPGREPNGETLVAHASPAWSFAAEQGDAMDVAEELWSEVGAVLGLSPVRPSRMLAYLWRQSIVGQALGETHLYSAESRVGVAGDWCLGAFAEHAFTSGNHLGRAIAAAIG